MKKPMEARSASSLAERIFLSECKLWVESFPLIPAFSNAALSASCSALRVIETAPSPFERETAAIGIKHPVLFFVPSNQIAYCLPAVRIDRHHPPRSSPLDRLLLKQQIFGRLT